MESKNKTKKAFYMALAFLAAVVIWIFVDLTGGTVGTPRIWTREFKDIPIEYLYGDTILADRGLMLLEEDTDTTVDLTLQGTHWDLAQVDREDILVTADLSKITTTGIQTVSNTPKITVRELAKTVEFKDISSYLATVNIGELNSKTVDVHYEVVGNVLEGHTAGEIQLSPTSFEIRGQKEAIDPVSYAKVTLDIGTDATATVSQILEYQFYDENDQLISSHGIHSDVETIQVTLPVTVTKQLELTMDFVEAAGARVRNVYADIQPKTVTVSGDAELLKDIDSLVLDRFELLTLGNSPTVYNYAIPIPEGCENLSGVSRATVQLSFKDMTIAEVPTARFRYENLPKGKDVDILTEELTVKIFGTAADVAAVTGEDIMVVADLTDFSAAAGSYTVPARILVESSGDIGVAGTYQVRVNITEPLDEPPEEQPEQPPEGPTE